MVSGTICKIGGKMLDISSLQKQIHTLEDMESIHAKKLAEQIKLLRPEKWQLDILREAWRNQKQLLFFKNQASSYNFSSLKEKLSRIKEDNDKEIKSVIEFYEKKIQNLNKNHTEEIENIKSQLDKYIRAEVERKEEIFNAKIKESNQTNALIVQHDFKKEETLRYLYDVFVLSRGKLGSNGIKILMDTCTVGDSYNDFDGRKADIAEMAISKFIKEHISMFSPEPSDV